MTNYFTYQGWNGLMKKQAIAVMLSIMIAAGSLGGIPVLAAEDAAAVGGTISMESAAEEQPEQSENSQESKDADYPAEDTQAEDTQAEETQVEETQIEENIKEAEPIEESQELASNEDNDFEDVTYEKVRTTSSFSSGSVYISRVGYGPVLRVSGAEILDMRNNAYYHIEGNVVKKDGSGPVFEISGNRIKAAFGSYLYEISGNNVNKIFGGFYASINNSSIQTHDLSERHEISGSLNLYQKLTVIALLFGAY